MGNSNVPDPEVQDAVEHVAFAAMSHDDVRQATEDQVVKRLPQAIARDSQRVASARRAFREFWHDTILGILEKESTRWER